MKSHKIIGIVLVVAVVIAVAAGAVWYFGNNSSSPAEMEEADSETGERPMEGEIVTNDNATHGAVYFADEPAEADPMMIGKWRNTHKPGWHKVYYDDYDEEEGLFWGKEWDEEEDVTEEDLRYHGNGWFRWDKRGGTLREFATMDSRDVPIAKIYVIDYISPDSLAYHEDKSPNQVYSFARP